MMPLRRFCRDYGPALVGLVLIAAVVVLCLMASSSSGAATLSAARSRVPMFGSGRVLIRSALITDIEVTGGALYVSTQRRGSTRDTLARVDPADGRVLARRALGATYDAGVRLDGSLWLVTSGARRHSVAVTLWQLDPLTLAVRHRDVLPGDGMGSGDQPLAVAGGRLWVAYDDRLAAIDPRTDASVLTRRVARAKELGVIAVPGGRMLIVSAGNGAGRGWLQERNAADGAFERTSPSYEGVTMPRLGGVDDGRLWISEATGMMGYAQAVSLRTLRALRTPAVLRLMTNGVTTLVADGILFVTQTAGGASRNYCGDPLSGAARATLPVAEQQGGLLAVLRHSIAYVGPPAEGGETVSLDIAPIPAACR